MKRVLRVNIVNAHGAVIATRRGFTVTVADAMLLLLLLLLVGAVAVHGELHDERCLGGFLKLCFKPFGCDCVVYRCRVWRRENDFVDLVEQEGTEESEG